MRSALLERYVPSHGQTRAQATWAWSSVRLVSLAVLLAAAAFAPQPARSILALPLCLVLPTTLWARTFHRQLDAKPSAAVPLGLMVTLAGWSLLDFVLLLLRAGSGFVASASALVLLCLYPITRTETVPALRLSGMSWSRISGAPRRVLARALPAASMAAAGSGGALLIWVSMARAKGDTEAGSGVYAIFWLGTAAIYVTAFVYALVAPRWGYTAVLVLLGVGSYAHVFLRSPLRPLMNDELGHWGEAEQILRSGRLFGADSVVGIGPKYPGLETLVAPIARVTDLPVMAVGQLVVALFHVAAVFGIAFLTRLVLTDRGPRAALLAACAYAINPSFLQIDSLFAYESFAIPLAIWAIAAALRWSSAPAEQRRGWALVTACLLAGSVINHHLSAFVLAGFLLVLALACMAFNRRTQSSTDVIDLDSHPSPALRLAPLLISGTVLLAGAILWAVAVSAPLINYLGVFPKAGWDALTRLAHGKSLGQASTTTSYTAQQTDTKHLFAGSLLPNYELISAIIMQPILLCWFLLALDRIRRRPSALRWGFAVIGSFYFLSLPATVIAGASSGAHRSWAFSYVGLAITLAAVSPVALAGGGAIALRLRKAAAPVLVLALSVALLGNYAAAVNAYQRFPGPYVLGVDGRDVTPDVVRASQWFLESYGPGQRVLTTLRVRAVFGAYADTQGISYPGWDIFFPAGGPPPSSVEALRAARIGFIVVDDRVGTELPFGPYFGIAGEPPPPRIPLGAAAVAKFDTATGFRLVHRDQHVSIYQVSGG